MTHKQADFNAHVMIQIIRENLTTGGDAKTPYNACDPEVKALINCNLTHSEKRALGVVPDDEPDANEQSLRAMVERRESEAFGLKFNPMRRLKGYARAMTAYQLLTA